jgi:hypothetical protein
MKRRPVLAVEHVVAFSRVQMGGCLRRAAAPKLSLIVSSNDSS